MEKREAHTQAMQLFNRILAAQPELLKAEKLGGGENAAQWCIDFLKTMEAHFKPPT